MTIQRVENYDIGTYTCLANNTVESDSGLFTLDVLCKYEYTNLDSIVL